MPHLDFSLVPVGTTMLVNARVSLLGVMDSPITGTAHIVRNDATHLYGEAEVRLAGLGDVRMGAQIVQTAPDELTHTIVVHAVRPFGHGLWVPTFDVRQTERYKIVSEGPNALELQSLSRPNEPHSTFAYVRGADGAPVEHASMYRMFDTQLVVNGGAPH